MKILVTGTCGFIGFSLANKLLKRGHQVVGLDNINPYYSIKFKINRLKELKKFKKFVFFKIDLTKERQLKRLSKLNFDYIFHFAAQPGVRYSLINPQIYYQNNIVGFQNLFKIINYKKLKKVFYASSSSVYGDQSKFPIKELANLNAKNPYGMSKIINENLAEIYCYKYKINFIGLRLFTVYGEWGRPDMFILKLLSSLKNKKKFNLNNSGNHFRDFTYIDDVVNICLKLIKKKIIQKNMILNICAGSYVNILSLTKKIIKYFPKEKKLIKNIAANKADVFKTFGSNSKLKKIIGNYKFKKIDYGLNKTISWFFKYNKNI